MDKAFHQLARLNKSADDSNLRLSKEYFPDFLHILFNVSLSRCFLTLKPSQCDDLLLEKCSELRHTASQIGPHILLDLEPRLHGLDLIHHVGVSVAEGLEEDA